MRSERRRFWGMQVAVTENSLRKFFLKLHMPRMGLELIRGYQLVLLTATQLQEIISLGNFQDLSAITVASKSITQKLWGTFKGGGGQRTPRGGGQNTGGGGGGKTSQGDPSRKTVFDPPPRYPPPPLPFLL